MRAIPPKLKTEILADPFYKVCIRDNKECRGRIEWEHAFVYAGRQINEKWAIVPVCTYHHREEGLVKNFNRWVAINRATKEDFKKYPKFDWIKLKNNLNKLYGK
jgi:hypothetical protein